MNTVYILGAGSSSFAGFPLASELWLFLKREVDQADLQTNQAGRQWGGAVDKVVSRLRAYQPSAGSPDLELVFTLVELADMQDGVLGALDLTGVDLRGARYGFARLVSSAFQWHAHLIRSQIFEMVDRGLLLDRDYVRDVMWAWADQVNAGDTIITFNWDPLHEMVLWNAGKWDYRNGYGFRVCRVPAPHSRVLILKLHGSCNWALQHTYDLIPRVEYIDHLFAGAPHRDNNDANLTPGSTADHGESLILPSYLKEPTQRPALLSVWEKAAAALRCADKVIVLGYSLPHADVSTRTMMSLALKCNNNLDTVGVVVGCDRTAYARWADFCNRVGKRVEPAYKTFAGFVLGTAHRNRGGTD